MGRATYLQHSFLGGEFSNFAQGRIDRPDYRIGMNVCFNAFPLEIGPWTRRPGSRFAGTTRGGANGRVAKLDFQQAQPYSLEFTDNQLRFRSGYTIITTNDSQVVIAVSTANPAVVQTTTAHGWPTGATVMFGNLGTTAPRLQARQFVITIVDPGHFSIADALTGIAIDGSTLGALSGSATVARVQELLTPYSGGVWANTRIVQAEATAIVLQSAHAPQAVTVASQPSGSTNAVFAFAAATFNDGPYLDPFTNGAEVTPSGKTGIISLQVSFPTYDATTAYTKSQFVTASGVNYVSLVDQNLNNTPAGNPSKWQVTSSGAAINAGQGFLGTDIGRLVRLFSEPPAWTAGSGYSAGNVVSYNPSGLPGAATYWTALGATTGNIPGGDTTHWTLTPAGAALWSWGRIVSLSNIIDPALAGSANFGSMTAGGGNSAAFDNVPSKAATASADQTQTGGALAAGTAIALTSYVGKNYSGASAQKITQAVIYPSNDQGITFGSSVNSPIAGFSYFTNININVNLRAKHTAPASSSDGTFLGSVQIITNTGSPQTITSNDQTTAWEYVWIEMVMSANIAFNCSSYLAENTISQVSFYTPVAAGGNATANVEILGPALLYTGVITTWRLGAFSDTTGWPTCGTYHEGRLWLGGAIDNRWDASVSNGIDGSTVNFAPTDQYGVVTAANAITYKLNSDGVNPMFWMEPDLQGVVIGTQAGEYLVQAPTSGPITAQNVAARRVTRIGCANVEPRRTEHTIIFVQRFGRKLLEYFADVFSGKLSGSNLADKAQHIMRAGIVELAYQSATVPIVWGRDALGALFGMTYKRDALMASQPPAFNAMHRHALGSGRLVNSITVGPSVGGNLDSLTMVTQAASQQQCWVEVLTDAMDEDAALADAWLLDGATVPSSHTETDAAGGPTSPYGGMTMNGLWHLNGQTVNVFAGGLDCGQVTVTNGSAFLPFGDGVNAGTGKGLFTHDFVKSFAAGIKIVVGFTYVSQGQILRPTLPQETGARLGPAFGLLRRNHRYALLVENIVGISVGATFDKMRPAKIQQLNGTYSPLQMYSGVLQDAADDDETYDGMLCWEIDGPLPGTVSAVSGNIDTKDQ